MKVPIVIYSISFTSTMSLSMKINIVRRGPGLITNRRWYWFARLPSLRASSGQQFFYLENLLQLGVPLVRLRILAKPNKTRSHRTLDQVAIDRQRLTCQLKRRQLSYALKEWLEFFFHGLCRPLDREYYSPLESCR